MITAGDYNDLKVIRTTEFGVYLDDEHEGILLPKRFVPEGTKIGDTLKVFIYHDSEDRIIATTQRPKAVVGEIVRLKAVTVTNVGAFLDWGLMKDLFVAKSQQLTGMRVGGEYIVKLYNDEQTGRIAATEKIDPFLSNVTLTVKELDVVDLLVYRRTDIGYVVIINNLHTGVLHFNEIYREIREGDRFKGFIKNILPENKINVSIGTPGYNRVQDEAGRILQLLKDNNGYLPYSDKSDPEEIYAFFGMSKKTFKMSVGKLYKSQQIELTKSGIKLVTED